MRIGLLTRAAAADAIAALAGGDRALRARRRGNHAGRPVRLRNPNYRAPEIFAYEELIFRLLPDITARLNALKSGQVDAAFFDLSTAEEAEESGFNVQTYVGEWWGLDIMDLEGRLVPALADLRVRQAIMHAFDRDGIVAALDHGYGTADAQVFAEGQPEHQPEDPYDYEPDRARELLAEAGHPGGFDVTIPTSTENVEATMQRVDGGGPRVRFLHPAD